MVRFFSKSCLMQLSSDLVVGGCRTGSASGEVAHPPHFRRAWLELGPPPRAFTNAIWLAGMEEEG